MALNDTLTGLPNRRYAMERLKKEWERARRHHEPFLCILLDIDHFKQVNDTHGHDAGDVVLQLTAQAMKACLRASDDICRFGGEEFLCICPGADISMAQIMGDRLRQAVADNHIETPQFTGTVTVSVGAGRSRRTSRASRDAQAGRRGALCGQGGRPQQGVHRRRGSRLTTVRVSRWANAPRGASVCRREIRAHADVLNRRKPPCPFDAPGWSRWSARPRWRSAAACSCTTRPSSTSAAVGRPPSPCP